MEAWLSATWYVLQGGPGEHLVLETPERRLSAFWTDKALAEEFLRRYPEVGLSATALESRGLKEAFLRALGLLGVEALLVDYRPGDHRARMVRLEELLEEVRRA